MQTEESDTTDWYGPGGFTNTIQVMGVKERGEWNLTMHGPDGTAFKTKAFSRKLCCIKK